MHEHPAFLQSPGFLGLGVNLVQLGEVCIFENSSHMVVYPFVELDGLVQFSKLFFNLPEVLAA